MTTDDEHLREIERLLCHYEDLPIDDAHYDKEFPLPAPHERSTCRCGASYDEAQFMALPPPTDADSVWSSPRAASASRSASASAGICSLGALPERAEKGDAAFL